MIMELYTDASYNNRFDISSCGFLVLADRKIIKHEVTTILGLRNISIAETWALKHGLQYCFMVKGVEKITAYTDHKCLITRIKRKLKYRELDDTIEMITDWGIELKINHVYAHKGNFYNNLVDRSCNNQLKKYVRKFISESPVLPRR